MFSKILGKRTGLRIPKSSLLQEGRDTRPTQQVMGTKRQACPMRESPTFTISVGWQGTSSILERGA